MTLDVDRSTWTRFKFGDVARPVKTKVNPHSGDVDRYIAGEHMDSDDLHITRWGTVGDGYLGPAFHIRFKPGQVLYGSRRTYLRKVAVADFDGVCANTTFVIDVKDPSVLLPELLPFVMTTEAFHGHSKNESKGSVNPYVNWPDISKYEFDLPPLSEQQRIADLLWSVEAYRRRLADQTSAAKSVGAVNLDSLVWAPGYPERELRDLLASCDYGTSERCTSEFAAEYTPVLRIPNVSRGALSFDDLKYLPESRDQSDPAATREGDFLVIRTNGNPRYVGAGALVPRLTKTTLFASYLLRLRAKRDVLLPEYLAACWNSPTFAVRLRPFIRSSAGNHNLSSSSILALRVPTPNVAEQRAIAQALVPTDEATTRSEADYEQTGILAGQLRRHIFGGAA